MDDEKILAYVNSHIELKTYIEYEIRKRELHEAITGLIDKAYKEGTLDIKSIEDFDTLVRLDLFLLEGDK